MLQNSYTMPTRGATAEHSESKRREVIKACSLRFVLLALDRALLDQSLHWPGAFEHCPRGWKGFVDTFSRMGRVSVVTICRVNYVLTGRLCWL
jgi:hypothetical protein